MAVVVIADDLAVHALHFLVEVAQAVHQHAEVVEGGGHGLAGFSDKGIHHLALVAFDSVRQA